MDQVVFHVDMDAFYASVHAREEPALRAVPLVVGANPRGGRGRGVVSTCNYAARAYGIRSAMPINEAYRRCPHAAFIRPDFHLYKPASQAVMDIVARYADVLQIVGMDEAYLDVTETCNGDFEQAHNLARSLQAAIKRETELSISIGIGPSKSVAKIASDHRKPHGIVLVRPDEVSGFLAQLPVKTINGCGPKTARRLEEWDIRTVGDLAQSDRAFLEARFGSHGGWLHDIANGIDERRVHSERGPSKSRGNERTYFQDEEDPERVHAHVKRLADGLLDAKDRRAFSTITIKVRYSDFTTLTRSLTTPMPLEPDGAEARSILHEVCDGLLAPLLDRSVRLVGVRFSGFQDQTGQRALSEYGIVGRPPKVKRPARPRRQVLRPTVLRAFMPMLTG